MKAKKEVKFTSKWLKAKIKASKNSESIIPKNENERRLLKENALKQAKVYGEKQPRLGNLRRLIKKLKIDEARAALILRNPNFLNIWKHHIQRLGIVGEDTNIKTGITILGGFRLVPDAKPESGNLVIDGKSSGGKSLQARLLLKSFVPSMTESFSKITPKVLAYYEKIDWTGKILSLIDAEDKVLNDPVAKTFLSGELQDSLITISGKAQRFHITGKPAIVITAVNPELIPENVRRLPTITVDESPEQTTRIHKKQAEDKKYGRLPKKYIPRYIQMAYARLKPVQVLIPFAEHIDAVFPKDDVITRTTFSWFTDYVSFHAALHQKKRNTSQRAAEGKLRIIKATKTDYEAARQIFNNMKLTLQTVPLSQGHRDLLKILRGDTKDKPDVQHLKIKGQYVTGFTTKELVTLTDSSKQHIGRLTKRLHAGGFIDRTTKKGITKNESVWWVTKEQKSFRMPVYKDLLKA